MRFLLISTIFLTFLFVLTLPGCSLVKAPTEPNAQTEATRISGTNLPNKSPSSNENIWYGVKTYQLRSDLVLPIEIKGVATFSTRGTDIIPTRPRVKTWTISVLVTRLQAGIDPVFPDGALYFTFGPSGTVFQNPAKVELKWALLVTPANTALNLYLWDNTSFSWVKKSNSNAEGDSLALWDKANGHVSFGVPHFSIWAISQD